jgi:hypothetical protein
LTDRRRKVPFNPEHFAEAAARGATHSPREAFRHAYEANLWSGPESVSGPGSSREQTAGIAHALPALCARLGIRTLLDLPCGDGHWMSGIELPGVRYIGADLLPEVIARAAARRPDREFLERDLTTDALPAADLLLCRDCLVHLAFADIARALANLRRSSICYLLTTTFPDEPANRDIITGDWRPLNLERPPFSFPPPLELLCEGCTEGDGSFADKSLGLWRLTELPDPGLAATM